MGKKKSVVDHIHRLFACFCSSFVFDKTPVPNFWINTWNILRPVPRSGQPCNSVAYATDQEHIMKQTVPEQHGTLMSDDVWSLTSDVVSVNLLMCDAPEPRNKLALTAPTVSLIERSKKLLVGDRLAALHLISLTALCFIYGLVLHLWIKCIWLNGS